MATDFKKTLDSAFKKHQQQLNGKGDQPFFKASQGAYDKVRTLDFPGRKHEEWKYTSFNRILSQNPVLLLQGADISSSWKEKAALPNLDVHYIYLVNGAVQEIEDMPAGVSISQNADSPLATANLDIFGNITQAFSLDHLSIEVKNGVTIEKPIYLVNFLSNKSLAMSNKSFNIKVGENAEATIIEQNISVGSGASFSNSLGHINVAPHGRLKHIMLQNDGETSSQLCETRVNQAKESVYTNYTFSISGEIVRNNLKIDLDDEHTEANLYGLYLLDGKQHVDNHTEVDHKVPNCLSNELYKGVLDGKSNGVFNGKVFVREDAQKTNAYQQNRNLLLSKEATINTKPQLEIWADDVKCSHGATVGQLDEDQLFYLKSRGIEKDMAQSLMVYAFASEVIERLPIDSLRQYLLNIIGKKLNFSFE